jgi:protoporphyrinogen/coproporphyrinogen III oxidase
VTPVHAVVIGGGISGLAAAFRLRRLLGARARITVVEQAGVLGGKLRTVPLAGAPYDVGAEAFLVRRPEALALVRELGLDGDLVHPGPAGALLRYDGRSAPLPPRTLLGVPATADGLDRVLSAAGMARVRAEPSTPLRWDGSDLAVGPLVARRLGPEVAQRLVEPLLGGVYAGQADLLGLRPTMPPLAAALDALAAAGRPPSLLAAAALALSPPGTPGPAAGTPGPVTQGSAAPPVFGALRGGMSVLVNALVQAADAELRLGLPVRGLARTAGGWRLEIGAAPAPEYLDADGVLLAVPSPALRRLLAPLHPMASAAAAGIDVASSVIVSLALPPTVRLPASSGVLIAAGEPLHTKAFTFSSVKWPHLNAGGATVLRASLGRYGETRTLQADDAELVRLVRADIAELTGITAAPVDAVVTRWGGGLPQYAVGHLDRVATIEAAASLPRLAVAGAALRGLGIPACIATADAAAHHLVAALVSGRAG